jgi:hypothetical protein
MTIKPSAQGGLPYETRPQGVPKSILAFAGVAIAASAILVMRSHDGGQDPARLVREYITQPDSCLHDTDFNPQNGALGPVDSGGYVDIRSGAGRLPEDLKLVHRGGGFVGYDEVSRHILDSAGCTLHLGSRPVS